jgi:flagellar assembly protein FliH
MSAPVKFLFEEDFGPRRGETDARITKAALELALAEAEARGQRAGFAAAEAHAIASIEHRRAVALERIAASVESLARALPAIEARLEAEATEIALTVARKLAPALIAREPLAEVAALVSDCLRHLVGTAHVVVRVNESDLDAARTQLKEIADAQGFGGRLVVRGEADIAPGDCRIEWADGGIVRERARAEAAIAQAVDRYLTARRKEATHE